MDKENFSAHEYFNSQRLALNSRAKIICKPKFRCKRMSCRRCRAIRRAYLIVSGGSLIRSQGECSHLILSWINSDNDPWKVLLERAYAVIKALSHKVSFFIRFLSLGERSETPHLHMIIKATEENIVRNLVKLKSLNCKHRIHCSSIYDPEGLLGYLFDQNFIPSFFHNDRPKGIRLISGSRKIKYGFPDAVAQKQIESLKLLPVENYDDEFSG